MTTFRIDGPPSAAIPLVLDSPHSGRRFPADFDAAVSEAELREGEDCFVDELYAGAAELAHSLGLAVNAGHDLDLDNLTIFRTLPHLAEVSIGHALISRALFVGLATAVREYREALAA